MKKRIKYNDKCKCEMYTWKGIAFVRPEEEKENKIQIVRGKTLKSVLNGYLDSKVDEFYSVEGVNIEVYWKRNRDYFKSEVMNRGKSHFPGGEVITQEDCLDMSELDEWHTTFYGEKGINSYQGYYIKTRLGRIVEDSKSSGELNDVRLFNSVLIPDISAEPRISKEALEEKLRNNK